MRPPPPPPPSQALLLVAPGATEVPAVQRLISELDQAQPTLLVLFNPKLVDMQAHRPFPPPPPSPSPPPPLPAYSPPPQPHLLFLLFLLLHLPTTSLSIPSSSTTFLHRLHHVRLLSPAVDRLRPRRTRPAPEIDEKDGLLPRLGVVQSPSWWLLQGSGRSC